MKEKKSKREERMKEEEKDEMSVLGRGWKKIYNEYEPRLRIIGFASWRIRGIAA